jgi:hypothetical protein
MKKKVLALLLAAAPTFAAQASVRALMNLGLDFGGDTLMELTYSDGSKSTITGGKGYVAGVGLLFGGGSLSFQTTVAYKSGSSKATTNGGLNFGRIPIDGLLFYNLGRLRVGGGVTYHLAAKLKGSKNFSYVNSDFGSALGYVGALDVRLGAKGRYLVGGRYTMIKYTPSGGSAVKGDSYGAAFGYLF